MSDRDLEGISRREFLKTSATAAIGGSLGLFFLKGCSPGTEPEPPKPPPAPNYVNSALDITDVFTNDVIPSGHVTFPNGKTVSVRDGLAEVTSSQELLAGSYRVLVQPESPGDFVTHSREIQLIDEAVTSLQVLPWTHKEFSYEQMLDKFMYGDDVNRYTIRWPDGAEITSYHYDESYRKFNDVLGRSEFIRSQDPDMLASQGFLEDTLAAYAQVVTWLPKKTNISLKSYVESEGEVDFPRNFDRNKQNVIFNSGEPDAPWGLTQGWNTNLDKTIRNASLRQRTGFSGADTFKDPGATRSDVIENFGIRTSGHGRLILDTNTREDFNSLAPLLLTATYSFAPGSGLYALDSPLPGKNGSSVSVVDHYVP